jgi:predicted nucleic acid-binding protein
MPRFISGHQYRELCPRGNPAVVRERRRSVPMAQVASRQITEAKLLAGLAIKPKPQKLAASVTQFLLGVVMLPWDSIAAKSYATLSPADLMQDQARNPSI